ncbi:MAG: GH3 auxin-responsive promoter family protein [Oligoflexia bacterium]|nr:GH3 auxin-responsive promoter family protein [Oligoflexia bacterium]
MTGPPTDVPFPLVDVGNGPYRLLRGGRRRAVAALRDGLADPAAAQARRLRVILDGMAGTRFAREHHLDRVSSLAELGQAVPVRTHADLLPWLDAVAAGESSVLTRDPVQMLLETSGTTGRPKHLPVTAGYADTVAEAQGIWMLGLVREHPGLTKGKALTIVSAAEHARSPGGLPIGSNTGRMLARQPWYVRLRYPVPRAVFGLPADQKIYALLRFALPARVTSITTANPSTILLLARRLQQWRQDLSADLSAGTLRHGPAATMDPVLRRRLERRLRRCRPPTGPWTPATLWPLVAVSCWTAGPAAYFASRLEDALGGPVPVHPVGVTASEGYFAVPLSGDWSGGALFVTGHVMEVLDESGEARPAHEAELGERLRLVITTEAGLCRYDLRDVIEVVGRCERTPIVRFVGKAGRYLNAVGERVTEAQLSVAARVAAGATGLRPIGFTARLVLSDIPNYTLAIEGLDPSQAALFTQALDDALMQQNVEYGGKRGSARLGPPAPACMPDGTYLAYRAHRVSQGAPDGQVKDPVMAVDQAEWSELLAAAQQVGALP